MIGNRFGKLEITAKLGEGGMGVVYEALDHDLGRKVAVKVLPPETSGNPQRLERFRREARAVAALNHPNIVTIHGIERAGDKQLLVMELVEGQSLERVIGDEGLPLPRVFDIAIPLAEALGAAHAKGVVHRDVKPANMMLTADGHVKVLDFGLAKAAVGPDPGGDDAAQALTRTTPLTGEGVVVGTAPYMSPEQLQGHTVDERSDIFSLGVVLFEMVTGKRPFDGDSRIALASSILKDKPDSVSELRADLPRHLGRIIRQCLEKDPDRRFQTARDVRNQLQGLREEILSGETPATPRRPRGSRAVVTAVSAVAVIALAIVGWRWLAAPGTAPPSPAATPRIVVLPFENLGRPDDEYFADGMTAEITSRLGGMREVAVISRASAMRYKQARPPLTEIGAELDVGYVLTGTVGWQRSDDGASAVRVSPELTRIAEERLIWSDSYEAVLADIFDVQQDIARQVSKALGATLAESAEAERGARETDNLEAYDTFLRANDYYYRSQATGHMAENLIAIRLYDDVLELDPDFALAHARRAIADADVYNSFEDHTPARLARIRTSVERALELAPGLPEAHHAKGLIQMWVGRDDRAAIEEFRLALSLGAGSETLLKLSEAQANLGLWEESEASAVKAAELDPHAGEYACSAGGLSIFLRNFQQALDYHERALRLIPDRECPYFCKASIYLNWDGDTEKTRRFLESLPPDLDLESPPAINHPWVWVEMYEGDYDAALRRLNEGDAVAYEFGMYYTPKDLIVARIHRLRGAAELARQHYEAARELLEGKLAANPDDTRLHGPLGVAYAALGRREDALREEREALRLDEARPGFFVGWNLRELAELRLLLGDRDKAVEYLERVIDSPSAFAAPSVKLDPAWRDLRDHPGFVAMLERHGG